MRKIVKQDIPSAVFNEPNAKKGEEVFVEKVFEDEGVSYVKVSSTNKKIFIDNDLLEDPDPSKKMIKKKKPKNRSQSSIEFPDS